MKCVASIAVDAPPERIYEIAHATERWPEILPHYRWVRVLNESGYERVVEMAAWRGVIPIRWTARQRNDPAAPRIHFTHLRGWTTGMEVTWLFENRDNGTLVSVIHELGSHSSAKRFLDEHVFASFIDAVVQKTLRCVKACAERNGT